MIQKVFSVRDEKVEAFMPPFFARARGEAVRSFMQAVAENGHPFSKSREDFVLYEIGSFDDISGRFTSVEPERVMSGFEAAVPFDVQTK